MQKTSTASGSGRSLITRSLDGGDGWDIAATAPHPRLSRGVLGYRGFRFGPSGERHRLEIPTGYAQLVIGFGEPVHVLPVDGSRPTPRPVTSVVCGPQTRAALGIHHGGIRGVDVLLAPWAVYELFGVPMSELPPGGVDPAELIGRPADHLAEFFADAPDWDARFDALDDLLIGLLDRGRPASPRLVGAWRTLVRQSGAVDLPGLAAEAEWSQRQLERAFREQVGIPAKAAARVLRLQRAVHLLVAGNQPVDVAITSGYYDQSHFSREFAAMVGVPPSRFAAQRAAMSKAHSDGDRAEGLITSLVPTQRLTVGPSGR